MTDGPLLLTTTEAGTRLGVSRRTIYRLIRAGLPTVVRARTSAYRRALSRVGRRADQDGRAAPGQVHDPSPDRTWWGDAPTSPRSADCAA
jgi:excisionase family DNA binding protein